MTREKRREYYAGGLMVLVGVSTTVIGAGYQIGSLTKMGPGFFPAVLGVLMAFMGVLIALTAALSSGETTEGVGVPHTEGIAVIHNVIPKPDWRGWGCIIGGVLLFIGLSQWAGLLAATFTCVFVAAMGDRTAVVWKSALLAAGVTAFGIFLFSYILRVQIPVIKGLWI